MVKRVNFTLFILQFFKNGYFNTAINITSRFLNKVLYFIISIRL